MERRIKKIGLLLIAILFLQLAVTSATGKSISNSSNSYIIVDNSGNGDYISIQEAIDQAPSGSTIHVKNGEYPEIIKINKKISLIGEDEKNTIINPTSKQNKYSILMSSSGSSIEGFTIRNNGPGLYTSAIRITANGNKISTCIISDTPVGITVWSSNNVIDDCHFSDCEDEGIALIGSSQFKCEKNEIKNCIFSENCDGIELQLSSGNAISNCEFYDNTHTGIDGIRESNNGNIISNCQIYNNDVHGIYFASSNDNQIIDCDVFDNKIDDIVFYKNSNNNIVSSSKVNSLSSRIQEIRQKIMDNLLQRFSLLKSSRLFERFSSVGF